ncbi:mucin-5AC [Drosophila grimshawi]|uniref:GH18264 n=1 Tax=Drosophila grimshawi TaxID=7222 RepID=B4JFH6_DROGR|nr:mucin-5AC [Drosophila grimshawi]EDV93457.1 GH18264 [Drosophila grimshawi]
MRRSLHWAMGACLLLLLWAATPTPTQARFIAKRETPNVVDNIGVDASTADRDIVRPSSESASGSEVTENRAKSVTEEEPNLKGDNSSSLAELKDQPTTEAAKQQAKLAVISDTETRSEEAFNANIVSKQEQLSIVNNISSTVEAFQATKQELNSSSDILQNIELSNDSTLQNVTATSAQAETVQAQLNMNKELKSTTAIPNVEIQQKLKPLLTQQTELQQELTTTTATTEATKAPATTLTGRSEDHARSMQFVSSTESYSPLLPVTPMKLRPLPMTRKTTTTTTHTPLLLAALLHAGVTVTPNNIASHENVIEEEQLKSQFEKRAKFISDSTNSTNAQQLLLPNAAEVWSLAAMKMVPTTTTTPTTTTLSQTNANATELANDIEPQQHQNQTEQHKEKNLLDWQQITLMQTSQENQTELTMSTTLDATEAATQATTTQKLAAMLSEKEMEMQATASSAVTASGVNQTTTESSATNEIVTTTEAIKAKPTLAAGESTATTTEAVKTELTEISSNVTATGNASAKLALTDLAVEIVTTAVKPALIEAVKPNLTEATTTATVKSAQLNLAQETVAATVKPALTESAQQNLTEPTTIATVKTALTDFAKINFELPKTTAAAIETETEKTTTTTRMPPAALPTAVPELPAITTTATAATTTATAATTTATTSTLASPLNGTRNANEMAMKATAHENNETGDKSNNVDSSSSDDDDVINVSVATSNAQTTLASIERQPITVSTRTAGEESTTTATTTTSTTTTGLLHAKLDELFETTTTAAISLTTPTPTEIVQISNEVNLPAIPIKNVTKENSEIDITDKNNVQTSGINNLLLTNSAENINNSAANSQTPQINNSAANSDTLQINKTQINNSNTFTTTTTTPTSLLIDDKTNGKLNEHETLLETNNISETAAITTTTTAKSTSTTEASTAAGAAVVNALDESTAATTTTTITITAANDTVTAVTAAKGEDSVYDDEDEQQIEHDTVTEQQLVNETNMATTEATTTTTAATVTSTTAKTITTTTTVEPLISLLDDSTTTTTTTTTEAVTTTKATTTTTTEPIYSSTVIHSNSMLPTTTVVNSGNVDLSTTTTLMPPQLTEELDQMQQPHDHTGTDVNVIIAITVSVIGVVALILLVAFLYLMRKRQKQTSYGQRCRPVSLDDYSLDNVSVLGGSVRRKVRDLRASKRTYGNAAFDDPSLRHNVLSAIELGKFVERRSSIFEEFRDVPQIIARADEVPAGCEDKNRYANVIPLPETRVVLQRQGDDDKTEYINANYVRGPRDAPNYYIACQAPLETTTGDFWRMIWEQQSRVIIQATDLNENGIERCGEYLPPSVTLDNHSSHGDYQVTLKHREIKDKYAISTLMLKRVDGDECRELTHYWYKWPETGVPVEEAPIIAMLLEARSSLKSYALEQANELKHEKSSTLTLKSLEGESKRTNPDGADAEKCSTSSAASNEINGNVANKMPHSQQGPLTIHCSPGTGRTGTIIACDMAIRSLETPKRSVDIPQLVYYVRRGRASAVQTKDQYEFIYKVANMYATKITNLSNDN